MAAGVGEAIRHVTRPVAGPVCTAIVLAAGAALFLAGDVAIRRLLRLGPVRLRAAAAVLALATTAIGALVALEVQLIVITGLLVVMLILEWREPTPTQRFRSRS